MEEKKVSWLELFFDLVFVTAVSFTTHLFIQIDHHPEKIHLYLGEYLLMVFPMFWVWTGQTMFFNRFSDKLRRPEIFMLPQMFFLIVMTASLDFEFSHTYHSYLASYAGLRLITVIQYYLAAGRLEGPRREAAKLLGALFIPGVLIPLSSLLFVGTWHYVIMYAGIAADMVLPLLFGAQLGQAPVNLGHLAERFGLFVLITFGESLVSINTILIGHTADLYTLAFAAAGFSVIGLMWASYFYYYENVVDHHKKTNGQILIYGHFLILVSIMALAGDIELLSEGGLPKIMLLSFLYGPVALFYCVENLVFYFHKKDAAKFYHKEIAVTLCLLLPAYLGGVFLQVPPLASLSLLALICLVQLLVQLGFHKKIPAAIYHRK
ncbi:low temperature requirement protein A [Deltaproteobacteria bacterium Smac51]|nr:low temperature requirement protein A [Deltaproteobacteria bacterium Smac51]